MTQESVLRIVIDSRNAERNAHALANELESIEKKGDFATKSMDSMSVATRQLAGYMAGVVTVGAAINKMDAYTSINNKLKLVTTSQTELNQAMQDTFAIAQRSASSWGAVNDVYSKYMSNSKTLNLTQAQTARLTEITSKAVAISGSTTESAAGALFQYGQALDGNILRGEEYNALVDGAGGLLGAMAKGLNVTRGELRQMMLDGKLTGEVITKALLKAGDSVDELFNKTDITIGQSLTILNDSITKFVGEASTGSGAATVLAGSIRVLAENLDLVVGGSIVLGIGYITTAIATKTLAVKADIATTLAQRAATQAQAIEEVKLATAVTNDAKAHLALTQATAAATQAKFGATAAATKYKMATDAVTQAVIRQEIAEKAAFGATVNMSRASAGLLGFLGGPLGIGLTLATVAAGYMLMRDSSSKATAAIDIQGQSVDDLVIKYRELNTLQRDNETKALADQVEDLSLKFRVASSDLTSFMQALPVADEKINTWSKLHSQFSLGKISSDEYYKSILALNILNDDQLDKVRSLIGGYDSSNTKMKEAEAAQKALASAAKKTTQEAKDQAVSISKLSEEIKKLLKEADKNSITSTVTATLASRGYNDELISIVNKYITAEGAITKNLQGQSVFRDEIKAKIEQEYTAVMKAKNATDARNEAEKKVTKEFEKRQKVLQVNAKVQALASKYNITAKETANNIPKGLISSMIMQESRGNKNAVGPVTKSGERAGGLAQFMPATAKQYGVNVFDEESSVNGMIKYMSVLIKQFGGDIDKAIMAYNAGPDNVRNGKAYSFKETKNYLSNVKGYMAGNSGFKEGDISSKEFDRILEDSTRVAIEQAKARTQLEVDVSNEVAKIRANLQAKLDEIDAANFSPEKAKELKDEYQSRADNDIAIANYALKTKLDDYGTFKKTESQLLEDSFNERKFYAAHDLELSKEDRVKAVQLLDDQLKQEQALLMLARETQLFQAQQSYMHEVDAMQERYRLERLEIAKIKDEKQRAGLLNASYRAEDNEYETKRRNAWDNYRGMQAAQDGTGEFLQLDFAKENASKTIEDSIKYNLITEQEGKAALLKVEEDYQRAKLQLSLNYSEKIAGSMADSMATLFGEQSGAYKAMFAVQKGFAIAQSMIAIQQGIANAMSLPFPTNLAAAATVAAETASVLSNIKAVTMTVAGGESKGYKSGGYTGNYGTSDVAGVVHGQEYVLNAAATRRVGVGTLDAINSGKSLGEKATVVQPVVNIHTLPGETADVSWKNGELDVRIRKIARETINSDANNPNSGFSKAMKRNFTVETKRQ